MSPTTAGTRAWLGLAALLAMLAALGTLFPAAALEWQPGPAAREPWRALSAVAVHYSPLHLLANLAGAALVGALGVLARVPRRSVLAWGVAWPLTQLGLLWRPELARYGGLSGVLHAGVAVAAVHLVQHGPQQRRLIGAALLVGLAVKVATEAPFGPALQARAGWDIPIAPFSHASGLFVGVLCALLALALPADTDD